MRTLSVADAVALIPDGASLMIGGFMAVGTPEQVVDELVRQGKRDLTVIANDTAMPGVGIGKLVRARLVKKAIVSHIGLNPETQQQMIAGEMEVDLVPQGTLIERIRAGGFGLGGILTATGVGHGGRGRQAEGRGGRQGLPGRARAARRLRAGPCLHGRLPRQPRLRADRSRNFNPVIAMAADTVIVAVDNVVPVGLIAPDHVITPAPLVDYLIAQS